jgi:hypothetical protein
MTPLPFARLALAAAFAAASVAAHAQTVATAKPTTAQPAKKAPAKKGAPAPEVFEPISEAQVQLASRVYTGTAQCEFNQSVSVVPVQDKPGYFKVGFNKASYTMTPQETTTGAVRLEDKKNGIVWLQIPAKSMMMNQKIGQRMVDGCTVAEQRAAS